MRKEIYKRSLMEDILKALILELEKSIQSRNRLALCRCLKKCDTLQETIRVTMRKR